jgi:hypothetical protein
MGVWEAGLLEFGAVCCAISDTIVVTREASERNLELLSEYDFLPHKLSSALKSASMKCIYP